LFYIYRKRSIVKIIESHRAFKTLFEQEESIINNFEKRLQNLQLLSNDIDKLHLFNELLSRAQSIEHMNDVAVKFIEEIKVIFIESNTQCFMLHVLHE